MKNENINTSSENKSIMHDTISIAYLVAIKSSKEIEQRIIVAKDVFDVEKKVKQSFKRIDWWEIRFNYGIAVF